MHLKNIHLEKDKNIKISLANAEFNCRVLGNGTKNIIAFHGFGQDGSAFLPLIFDQSDYKIYSFDLPFHGNTTISDPSVYLTSNDVISLIEKLVSIAGINRFSLLGFSMGAKLLFPVLYQFNSQIDQVWLLAPDGIKQNIWYQIATSTNIMRGIFRWLLQKKNGLNTIASGLERIKIIDKKTLKFALSSLNSHTNRERIVDSWIYLRKLKLNSKEIARKVNNVAIEIYFIIGDKDTIISKKAIKPLTKKINDPKTIVLDSEHHNLIGNFAAWKKKNPA